MNIGKPFSAVRRLFIPSLLFISLFCTPGCGGEDAPQSHTDTAATGILTPSPPTATVVEDSATDSVPTAAVQVQPPTDTLRTEVKEVKKKEAPKTNDSVKAVKVSGKENAPPQAKEKGGEKIADNKAANSGGCAEATPELQKQGRMVFIGKGNCISCHGADGKGQVLGPDLTDNKWLHINGSYPAIAGIVRTGVNLVQEYPSPMPPMGGSRLTDEDICAVAAYVWSLSH